jgi:hypothetical protein
MRTLGSFNHPGRDEEPTAILLRNSPQGSGAGDPTAGDPARVATRAGSILMQHPHSSDSHQYKELGALRAERLEGWKQMRSSLPSFETVARGRATSSG